MTDEQLAVLDSTQVDLSHLRLLRPIGLGGQGRLAAEASPAASAARSSRCARAGSPRCRGERVRVFTEKECLEECKHPFVTRLFGTFQDDASSLLPRARPRRRLRPIDLFPNGPAGAAAEGLHGDHRVALRHPLARVRVPRREAGECAHRRRRLRQLCDFGFAKAVPTTAPSPSAAPTSTRRPRSLRPRPLDGGRLVGLGIQATRC